MIPEVVQARQASQLREWHRYIVKRYATECRNALEVGCGAGYVMENLSDMMDIKGIDIDPKMVGSARKRGLDAFVGNGLELPPEKYDLVYCSFYLMWVRNVRKALMEMIEHAEKGVLILSEPVWSSAVFSPEAVDDMVQAQRLLIKHQGGDPDGGITLIRTLREMKTDFKFGIVPSEMSPVSVDENVKAEYDYLESKGFEVDRSRADLFTVPFVWAYVPIRR
jgi:SAM-dependent methyltransferase